MKYIVLMTLLFSSIANASEHVEDFNVTDGKITLSANHHLMVSSKEMRATLRHPSKQAVTIHFKYLGPTQEVSHLQNGEVRHQFGIKFKAQDICNLVYVMWDFDIPRINVAVKKNPGQQTSEQCKDRGYHSDFKTDIKSVPTRIVIDTWHTLSAKLIDKLIAVSIDNTIVWRGEISDDQMEFHGPVGIRSDNVHVLFDYDAIQ